MMRLLVTVWLLLVLGVTCAENALGAEYVIDARDPSCDDTNGPTFCSFKALDHRVFESGDFVRVKPGFYRWTIVHNGSPTLPGELPRWGTIKLVAPGSTIIAEPGAIVEVASVDGSPAFAAIGGAWAIMGLEIRGRLLISPGVHAYANKLITVETAESIYLDGLTLGPIQGPRDDHGWWDQKDDAVRTRGDVIGVVSDGTESFTLTNSKLTCMERGVGLEERGLHVADGIKFHRPVASVSIVDNELNDCGHNVIAMNNGEYRIQRNRFSCWYWVCVAAFERQATGVIADNIFRDIGVVPMDQEWAGNEVDHGKKPNAIGVGSRGDGWIIENNHVEFSPNGFGYVASGSVRSTVRGNVFVRAGIRVDAWGEGSTFMANTMVYDGLTDYGAPDQLLCDDGYVGNEWVAGATVPCVACGSTQGPVCRP